jgi:predicted nucleic acid-binding protein
MSKFVLDTVVLRVFAFAHPQGIDILLEALNTSRAGFPTEVYNQDEDNLPLNIADEDLSELARGLRYARRQVQTQPGLKGQRFQVRLENATQLERHIQVGSLFIEPLELAELPRRENLMKTYGVGRGEAACLVLALRTALIAVFLSSDKKACIKAAQELGISFLTIPDILTTWVRQTRPSPNLLQELIDGMRNANFALKDSIYQELQCILSDEDTPI